MRGVQIDPGARCARVQAGVLWGKVAAAAAGHGLAGLAGSSSTVGVVGYSIGGGVGWLARRYGLAANSILAIGRLRARPGGCLTPRYRHGEGASGQNAASCSRVSPDRPMLSMVRARSAAKSSPATMEAMWITASMVGVGTDRCRARSVRNTIE